MQISDWYWKLSNWNCKYQPSGAGGTRSPPATPQGLQNPKWPLGGPKMAHRVWKGTYPYFGHSCSTFVKQVFWPSTPFMRKVDNRETEKNREKVGCQKKLPLMLLYNNNNCSFICQVIRYKVKGIKQVNKQCLLIPCLCPYNSLSQ